MWVINKVKEIFQRTSIKISKSLRGPGEVESSETELKRLVMDAVTLENYMTTKGWEIYLEQCARYREFLLSGLAEDIKRGKADKDGIANRAALIAGMGENFIAIQSFMDAAARASQTLNIMSTKNKETHKEFLRQQG